MVSAVANVGLNVMSFPSASLARLKSSVANIVTIALQTDASAVCRPVFLV